MRSLQAAERIQCIDRERGDLARRFERLEGLLDVLGGVSAETISRIRASPSGTTG